MENTNNGKMEYGNLQEVVYPYEGGIDIDVIEEVLRDLPSQSESPLVNTAKAGVE